MKSFYYVELTMITEYDEIDEISYHVVADNAQQAADEARKLAKDDVPDYPYEVSDVYKEIKGWR